MVDDVLQFTHETPRVIGTPYVATPAVGSTIGSRVGSVVGSIL